MPPFGDELAYNFAYSIPVPASRQKETGIASFKAWPLAEVSLDE